MLAESMKRRGGEMCGSLSRSRIFVTGWQSQTQLYMISLPAFDHTWDFISCHSSKPAYSAAATQVSLQFLESFKHASYHFSTRFVLNPSAMNLFTSLKALLKCHLIKQLPWLHIKKPHPGIHYLIYQSFNFL